MEGLVKKGDNMTEGGTERCSKQVSVLKEVIGFSASKFHREQVLTVEGYVMGVTKSSIKRNI